MLLLRQRGRLTAAELADEHALSSADRANQQFFHEPRPIPYWWQKHGWWRSGNCSKPLSRSRTGFCSKAPTMSLKRQNSWFNSLVP
ncbi:hypothetical protein ACQP1G_39535 [Nocardia sp. CA-107356]|uniref:hypothetical protein n=1 Tax=Nocardia sp. CA-107356 TaxID=3239972 RepID=UPI003D89B55E